VRNFNAWLNAAETVGYLDSAVFEDGVYTLSQGNKSLQLMRKGDECLLWSSAVPDSLRKVVGSGVERALPRLVVSFFTGLGDASFTDGDNKTTEYKDVGIFPSKVVSGKVEFSDHAGRTWVCQSSNVPEITLKLYKNLMDACADHSLLLLPGLYPRSEVKVFSGVEGSETKTEVGNVAIMSSVEEMERSIPNLQEYLLFPKEGTVPEYGMAIVSGLVATAADRLFVERANREIAQFLKSTRRPVKSEKISSGGWDQKRVREQLNIDFPHNSKESLDKAVSIMNPARSASAASTSSQSNLHDLVSSAELFKLKLNDSGSFQIDMGSIQNDHEVYSSLKGTCDVGQLLGIGRKAGFTYTDIASGVDFTGSVALPELKKFLVASAKFQSVPDPVIKREVASWVISGKELGVELNKWGIKNPGGVFSAMQVLGVDLDGTSKFKVPVKSEIDQKRKQVYDRWVADYESGFGDNNPAEWFKQRGWDIAMDIKRAGGEDISPNDAYWEVWNYYINSSASPKGKVPVKSGVPGAPVSYAEALSGDVDEYRRRREWDNPLAYETEQERLERIKRGVDLDGTSKFKVPVKSVYMEDIADDDEVTQKVSDLADESKSVEEIVALSGLDIGIVRQVLFDEERVNVKGLGLSRSKVSGRGNDGVWHVGPGRVEIVDPEAYYGAPGRYNGTLWYKGKQVKPGAMGQPDGPLWYKGKPGNPVASNSSASPKGRVFQGKVSRLGFKRPVASGVYDNPHGGFGTLPGDVEKLAEFLYKLDKDVYEDPNRSIDDMAETLYANPNAYSAIRVAGGSLSEDGTSPSYLAVERAMQILRERVESLLSNEHSIAGADTAHTGGAYSSASKGSRVNSDFYDDFGDSWGSESELVEDDPEEPEDGDIVVNEYNGIYEEGGRWRAPFQDWGQAGKVIREKMERDGYFPNVWLADDHGGFTLTSIE
jgi:hypothetical protein